MKTYVLAVAAALALASMGEAWSQQYPTRPIRIVVLFSAGSQTDLFTRIIAPKMSENWSQQVVVDNRPSAGGIVAGTIVSGATPDSYTLMLTSSAYAVSAAITPTTPEEFAGLLRTDIEMLKKVAKAANIRID